ncbi:MAG: hypothetical protein KAJ55_17235 [Anaerolineales bacterium]|nr:hypothetical protein [Anaerolineales bacterium]
MKNINTSDAFISVTDEQFELALKEKALSKKKPSTVAVGTNPEDVVFSFDGTEEEFNKSFPEVLDDPPTPEKVVSLHTPKSIPQKIQKAKEVSGLQVNYFYQVTHNGEIIEEGELAQAKDRWELLELKKEGFVLTDPSRR